MHIDGLKMSKSLKNFITIKELLSPENDTVTVTPDDFRLFCLLHHYRSNVTYSMDRIHDARAVRKIFHGFLLDIHELAQKKQVAEGESPHANKSFSNSKRWSSQEILFHAKINSLKSEYIEALSDDFNTPKAMLILRDVCQNTRKQIQSHGAPPSELLYDVYRWLHTVLRNIGLSSVGIISDLPGAGGESSGAEHSLAHLESFAEFRSNVRRVARGMEKSNEKIELLTLCDKIRDEIFPTSGYELRDTEGDNFTIRKL